MALEGGASLLKSIGELMLENSEPVRTPSGEGGRRNANPDGEVTARDILNHLQAMDGRIDQLEKKSSRKKKGQRKHKS